MKQTIIACLITAATSIAFSIIFMLVMQKPIPNHSAKFTDLDEINERVRRNEVITWNRIDSLFQVYNGAQSKLDSLGAILKASNSKMVAYDKQLKELKANIKTTNYQDSSKTAILNTLPK